MICERGFGCGEQESQGLSPRVPKLWKLWGQALRVPEKGAAACLHRRGINLEMLKPGCACHYTHFDNSPDYAAAGSEARAAKRGLWSAPHPINPYDFRKAKRNGRNGKN